MAIVNCPNCSKHISSLTNICPYCDFVRGDVAEEALKEARRRAIKDQIYRLKMASYGALTLLLIAFGWYMADTSGFQQRASAGPYMLFTVGAVIYLLIRALLLKSSSALKKIRRGAF